MLLKPTFAINSPKTASCQHYSIEFNRLNSKINMLKLLLSK